MIKTAPSTPIRPIRSRAVKKSKYRYIVWLVLAAILFFVIYRFIIGGTIQRTASSVLQSFIPTPTPTIVQTNPLEKLVKKPLQNAQGDYAVIVKDLKYNDNYGLNIHKQFETASIYKLWVLAGIYQKIEKGDLNKDDVLQLNAKELSQEFDIDEEDAEEMGAGTKYKVTDALEKMIVISDNYAALLLTHELTYAGIDRFLATNGLTESKTGKKEASPVTTAHDISLYYEKLYAYKLATKEHTEEMIDLLKRTQFVNVLPKYIKAEIAHKTGTLESVSNDAGIVFTPKGDFIIGVFSKSGSPPDAEERMARIGEAVYNYFISRKEPETIEPTKNRGNVWLTLTIALTISIGLTITILRSNRKK